MTNRTIPNYSDMKDIIVRVGAWMTRTIPGSTQSMGTYGRTIPIKVEDPTWVKKGPGI